jgi:hypothetical protein
MRKHSSLSECPTYIQRRTVSKQEKSLKHTPVEEQETAIAACFKQACASSASVDGNIQEESLRNTTYMGEQRLCWLDLQI